MVRDYELMYIVRPELDDDALRASTESVESIIRDERFACGSRVPTMGMPAPMTRHTSVSQ